MGYLVVLALRLGPGQYYPAGQSLLITLRWFLFGLTSCKQKEDHMGVSENRGP